MLAFAAHKACHLGCLTHDKDNAKVEGDEVVFPSREIGFLQEDKVRAMPWRERQKDSCIHHPEYDVQKAGYQLDPRNDLSEVVRENTSPRVCWGVARGVEYLPGKTASRTFRVSQPDGIAVSCCVQRLKAVPSGRDLRRSSAFEACLKQRAPVLLDLLTQKRYMFKRPSTIKKAYMINTVCQLCAT